LLCRIGGIGVIGVIGCSLARFFGERIFQNFLGDMNLRPASATLL
jgi:hypothetical protein